MIYKSLNWENWVHIKIQTILRNNPMKEIGWILMMIKNRMKENTERK